MYATINPPIKLNIDFLGLSYSTMTVDIKNIVFSMFVKEKYHNPILKQQNVITAIIAILINNDSLPFPFAYQEMNASIGENNVIPYHIII